MNCDAVILAGGLGTRLSHLIPDLPKPMAPVNGEPFLALLLEQLSIQNFNSIILSVGHKYEKIQQYFGNNFNGVELIYCIENTPLGTGGAIKKALAFCKTDSVFILNGDTYFDIDFNKMNEAHITFDADVTLAIKSLKDFSRYGTVLFKDNRITGFKEKAKTKEGYINGGTYLLKLSKLPIINWPEKFSFEKDFLEKEVFRYNFVPFASDKYFIDIGIPEDYSKSCLYFKKLNQNE